MPSVARKVEIREANESRILSAAEAVFASDGYKGATTERIARAAGLPKANVHYYFKTKANLYQAVLKSILDDWMVAAEAFDSSQDPEKALRAYIAAKMTFSRKRPFGSRVWAKEIMNGAPIMDQFLATQLKTWVDERVLCIRRWIKEERMQPVDPKTFLFMIWATTQHYADFEHQIALLNKGKPVSDRQYRQYTQHVMDLTLRSAGITH